MSKGCVPLKPVKEDSFFATTASGRQVVWVICDLGQLASCPTSCYSSSVNTSVSIFTVFKDSAHAGIWPALVNSFKIDYVLKTLFSDKVTPWDTGLSGL